jgi:hypothetical protein
MLAQGFLAFPEVHALGLDPSDLTLGQIEGQCKQALQHTQKVWNMQSRLDVMNTAAIDAHATEDAKVNRQNGQQNGVSCHSTYDIDLNANVWMSRLTNINATLSEITTWSAPLCGTTHLFTAYPHSIQEFHTPQSQSAGFQGIIIGTPMSGLNTITGGPNFTQRRSNYCQIFRSMSSLPYFSS